MFLDISHCSLYKAFYEVECDIVIKISLDPKQLSFYIKTIFSPMVLQSSMAADHQNDYALDSTMAADIKMKV